MENNRIKKIHEFSQNMITYLDYFKTCYPNESLFDKLLAQTYYEMGEKEFALFYCEKALTSDPEDQKMILLKNKL